MSIPCVDGPGVLVEIGTWGPDAPPVIPDIQFTQDNVIDLCLSHIDVAQVSGTWMPSQGVFRLVLTGDGGSSVPQRSVSVIRGVLQHIKPTDVNIEVTI